MNIDTKKEADILVIGAGAAGLMAARRLGKAEKKVTILEARNRIGGRIFPLDQEVFGYPAQGGAEWVHGEAPITKALVKEAGLTLIPEEGEIWSTRSGELAEHESFIQNNPSLAAKLESVTEDISIADFLEQNFTDEKDADFKNSIIKMVEGYDAADPRQISTLTLRDEWLSRNSMTKIVDDCRIKEGYGALMDFLKDECTKYNVTFRLNTCVAKIGIDGIVGAVHAAGGEVFMADKVIITVPLPVLKDIELMPELKWKQDFVSKVGFGNAIKVLIKFKTCWWREIPGKDFRKMAFILSNEKFLTWWTQYPDASSVLTGWMGGPIAVQYKESSPEAILDIALASLSNIFKINKETIAQGILYSQVINWPADPFAKGVYSYTTVETKDAYDKLVEPHKDTIFFAGEALYSGDVSTATVEGALGSGKEVADRILVNVK